MEKLIIGNLTTVTKSSILDITRVLDPTFREPLFCMSNIVIKNSEEVYERIIEMSKKIGCAIGNLLDYEHFSNYYKLISSKQAKRVRKPKHNTTN